MVQQAQTPVPAQPGASTAASTTSSDAMSMALAEVEAVNREAGENPVKIGILAPMTPPGDAIAGVLAARGARVGAEYLREHGGVLGGRNVQFVAYNDSVTASTEGFGRSAVGGAAKLAVVDEVLAMFGLWHLRTTGPVAELTEKFGLPMFVENGHDTVTHGRRSIFRTYFSLADRAPLMIDCLAHIGARRIGMIAADTVFGKTAADDLQQYGESRYGMEFLRIDFEQEVRTDWRDDLRRIKAWRPDAFIDDGVNVVAGGGPVGNNYLILQQAIEVGLLPGPPVMVPFGFPARSQDYWRMAGKGGVGVMWPATRYRPLWSGMTEVGRWFTDRFTDRYGVAPPDPCLSAFTDVTIIGQALNAAGEASREALLDALESMEFDTWRGKVRFDRGPVHWHHSPPELLILQYQKFEQLLDDAAIIYPRDIADGDFVTADALPEAGVPG